MNPRDPKDMRRLWMLALFAVAAIVFSDAARASTPRDAERVAWYLKGEGDLIFGARGWTVSRLTCRPLPGRYIACKFRLNNLAAPSLCSTGRFKIDHFRVTGQWARPQQCGAPPA